MKSIACSILILSILGACSSDNTPPAITSIAAVDYRHADITFSEEVDSASGETAANYSLSPDKLTGQGIEAVAKQSATVYRITTAKTMLPVTYTVTVSGVKDPTGNEIAAASTADFAGNGKVAFITTARGKGKLSGWADSGEKDGLEGADNVCAAEAARAGLTGTFKAWLSDGATGAITRIGNDSGPWIRTDGFPFAPNTLALLNDNQVLVPLTYDGAGVQVDALTNASAWTYTTANGSRGASGNHCTGWTADASGMGLRGNAFTTALLWTDFLESDCGFEAHLYCFQTGAGPTVPDYQTAGKRVFVTSGTGKGRLIDWDGAGGATGIPAADNICQAHATGAGLANPLKFKAWLSNDLIDAVGRLNWNGPWVLVNGVKIADDKNDLIDGDLFTSIVLDESGTIAASPGFVGDGVFTGTKQNGTKESGRNCLDWANASSGEDGLLGVLDSSAYLWTEYPATALCNSTAHLYCFEDE